MKALERQSKTKLSRQPLSLRVHSLRREAGMTQIQLAEILGVSRSYVSAWENGTRVPDRDSIEYMSRLFGVSADYLYGISNDRFNIKIPEHFELDLTKLNTKGMEALGSYYKLLLCSDEYRMN